MLNKEKFLAVMDNAIAEEKSYVAILVEMPNCPAPELIINTASNFTMKREYIDSSYDEQMEHNHAEGVRIIEVFATDMIAEIALNLLDYTVKDSNSTKNLIN